MNVILSVLLLVATGNSQRLVPRNFVQTSKRDNGNRRCVNPNGRSGACVQIWNCQVLTYSTREFVEASNCGGGFGRTPFVCCSSDTGFIQTRNSLNEIFTDARQDSVEANSHQSDRLPQRDLPPSNTSIHVKATNLLPKPPTCGGEFIDSRIYGGKDADIYEFPWMAFLEYSKADSNKEAICAGSLINSNYVLTAAHCVLGEVVKVKGELVAARLGVYDYSNLLQSSERLRVVEKMVHEDYKIGKTPINDVALLRLEIKILYSNTIRPICLPSVLTPYTLKPNIELTVVGWGATQRSSSSSVKKKVNVPLVDQKYCYQQFAKAGISIQSSHLCAGGVSNKDSCRGDSGAPLMHYRNGVWVLEGIVSFGRRCGYKDWPGVYTRINSYFEWIMKKLRP